VSVGAVVAAAHAAEHAVGALVLVAGWTGPTARRNDWIGHAHDPAFARHTLLGPEGDREPPAVDAAAARVALTADAGELAAIDRPALVVGAAHDVVAPVGQTRLLFGGIPGAEWAELPTGHAALVERPAEVLALVGSFLSRAAVPR
jgi:pimeloyl-ACP methyl ester carboxylesterase